MKITYLFLALTLLSGTTLAQGRYRGESNLITRAEANNIKFNGVLFSDINATNGDEQKMEALFNTNFNVSYDSGLNYGKILSSWAVTFVFATNELQLPNETSIYYFAGMYQLRDPNFSITVKGRTARLYDNISVLGNVKKRSTVGKNDNGEEIIEEREIHFYLLEEMVLDFSYEMRPHPTAGRCGGTEWHTTTGYYDDEGYANGDCDDDDPIIQCGDGTWACIAKECYPVVYPIEEDCTQKRNRLSCMRWFSWYRAIHYSKLFTGISSVMCSPPV